MFTVNLPKIAPVNEEGIMHFVCTGTAEQVSNILH
jgi:hypothetical protein